MGIGAAKELHELRQQVRASGKAAAPPVVPGPKPRGVATYAWDDRANAFINPLLGLCLLPSFLHTSPPTPPLPARTWWGEVV
jgi:hypothetical protein